MKPTLRIKPQGPLGRFLDKRFEGIMRHLAGSPQEGLQKTHRWNNHHLRESAVAHLDYTRMVWNQGDDKAREVPNITIVAGAMAHATRFGGWQRYLVLAPRTYVGHYFIGWHFKGGAGVSRIPSLGKVRVLVGPSPCHWFAIRAGDYEQIALKQVGEGIIGVESEFSHLPLF